MTEDYTREDLREIDTNIERIFYAARVGVPDAAWNLSGASNALSFQLKVINAQAAKAGDPTFLTTLLKVGGSIYDELRFGVAQLNNFAGALEKTGQDFLDHDQAAQQEYRGHLAKLDDSEAIAAYEPPALDEPLDAPGAPSSDPGLYGPKSHPGPYGYHPVESTPDPEAPSADAEQREDNEDASEYGHAQIKRRG